jgi:hypothetical protein
MPRMQNKEILGVLSLVIAMTGYVPYIVNIFRGKTKPHAYTWLTWEVLAIVGFGIQLNGGGGPGTWLLGLTTLMTMLIFLLSLKYGHKDIHVADTISLIFAGATLIFWILTDQPLVAAVLISVIEATGGFFPTFRKSYKLPFEETLTSYVAYTFSTVLALIALSNRSIEIIFYPVVVMILNISFVIFVMIRRNKLKRRRK